MIALLSLLLATPQAGSDLGLPPTRLATELLAQRPVVALARTVSSTNFGIGTAVVRLRIVERLAGDGLVPGDLAVVFAYADHFRAGDQSLVYLLPFGQDGRWRVLARIDARDRDWLAKLAVTRRTLALLQVPGSERVEATFAMLLDLLAAHDEWSRGWALAELRWMARHHADLFTPVRQRRLLAAAHGSPHDAVRAGVESVTLLLPTMADSLLAPDPPQSSPP